ncbi:hypothetical protein SFA35_16135 [Pseudomonas sp. HR96]|uniref:hypothetical protein n=1 Tax=Pseudomonas sp. HR96 TaxID=1027966 RepID=UPI002A75E9FD|nr:hypothetical protein [Pseudomonas sp. HR96]WPO98175.1 hypothetical protein SFA35_16135 [Pseudomonas sp. HR96]
MADMQLEQPLTAAVNVPGLDFNATLKSFDMRAQLFGRALRVTQLLKNYRRRS